MGDYLLSINNKEIFEFYKKHSLNFENLNILFFNFLKTIITDTDNSFNNNIANQLLTNLNTLTSKIYLIENNVNKYQTDFISLINNKLNDISNVTTFNMAVGKENKIINEMWYPILDKNYGCIRINHDKNLINTNIDVNIEMIKMNDLILNEQVHFIKIDVEGCEEEVLEGGINLIKSCKPVILIENWSETPYKLLLDLGYKYIKLSHCNYLYIYQ